MYFYVPEENIEIEKQDPGTSVRLASEEGRGGDGGLCLWNQSMLIIAQLLTAGLLHINELDPIRRYLPSFNRPRKGGRYSAFQVGSLWHLVVWYYDNLFKVMVLLALMAGTRPNHPL